MKDCSKRLLLDDNCCGLEVADSVYVTGNGTGLEGNGAFEVVDVNALN